MISVGSFSFPGMCWTEQQSPGDDKKDERSFSCADLGHELWRRAPGRGWEEQPAPSKNRERVPGQCFGKEDRAEMEALTPGSQGKEIPGSVMSGARNGAES